MCFQYQASSGIGVTTGRLRVATARCLIIGVELIIETSAASEDIKISLQYIKKVTKAACPFVVYTSAVNEDYEGYGQIMSDKKINKLYNGDGY